MHPRRPAHRLVLVLAAAMLAGCPSPPGSGAPAAVAVTDATLLELEARFAAASRAHGMQQAFLEFLGEGAVVLQPGPTPGRAAWSAAGELPGTLDWLPDRAQISAGGDLGFASGPWHLAPQEADGRHVEGRYITVWRKTAAGWRVAFDGGFGRAPAGAWEKRGKTPALHPYACERGTPMLPGELQLLDLAMSGITGGDTHQRRILALLDAGAALFHAPAVEGASDASAREAALGALPATQQYRPMGAGIASAADLGYSYGLSAPAPGADADAAYAHVWCRRGAGWSLVLQLRTRLPTA